MTLSNGRLVIVEKNTGNWLGQSFIHSFFPQNGASTLNRQPSGHKPITLIFKFPQQSNRSSKIYKAQRCITFPILKKVNTLYNGHVVIIGLEKCLNLKAPPNATVSTLQHVGPMICIAADFGYILAFGYFGDSTQIILTLHWSRWHEVSSSVSRWCSFLTLPLLRDRDEIRNIRNLLTWETRPHAVTREINATRISLKCHFTVCVPFPHFLYLDTSTVPQCFQYKLYIWAVNHCPQQWFHTLLWHCLAKAGVEARTVPHGHGWNNNWYIPLDTVIPITRWRLLHGKWIFSPLQKAVTE